MLAVTGEPAEALAERRATRTMPNAADGHRTVITTDGSSVSHEWSIPDRRDWIWLSDLTHPGLR